MLSSMQALGCIYALSQNAGSTIAEREETFNQVKRIIENQAVFDPATFGVISGLLNSETVTSSDVEKYSNLLGGGVQAVIGGGISPDSGLALSLAGVMAEATLGLGSGHSVIAQSTDQHLNALSDLVYRIAMDKATQNQQFEAFFMSPEYAELTHADPRKPLQESISQLPDSLQEPVRRALQNDGTSVSQREIMKEIQETMARKFADLKMQQEQLSAELKNGRLREELRKKSEADFQRGMLELEGAAKLGSSIISTVCGNQRAAQVFQTSVQTVGKIYQAMFLHAIGKAGTLATLGTFFGATTTLFNVLGGASSSETAQIKQSLDAIHEKLREIEKRLGVLEERSLQILDGLSKIYEQVVFDSAETRVRLVSIEELLRQNGTDDQQSFRDLDLHLLGDKIDEMKSLLRKNKSSRNDLWLRDYANALTFFYSFALRRSASSHFTGNVNTPISLGKLANNFKSKPTIDLSFGLLPQIASLANIPANTLSDIPVGVIVPNPMCWAAAVNAYLEARVGALEVQIEDDKIVLPELWKMGVLISRLANEMSSQWVILRVVPMYIMEMGNDCSGRPNASLMGLLYRSLDDFEKKVTQPDYKIEVVPGHYPKNGETRYSDGAEASGSSLIVTNDPFQKCLDTGLLKKHLIYYDKVETKRGVRERSGYKLEIRRGPDAGTFFMDGKIMYESYGNFPSVGEIGIRRYWNPVRFAWPSRNPQEFFAPCLDLIRRIDNHDAFKAGVVSAIETSLATFNSTNLDGAALLLSFLSSIAFVRMSGEFAGKDSFEISNVPVITNDSRLIAIARESTKKLRRTSSCRDQMIVEIKYSLDKELHDLLSKVDNASEKDSIFVVDETLRRLAGLMRVCSIPVPELSPERV